MSNDQLNSEVIQNVSPKGTLQRYNDVVNNVCTILGGFRQELIIFKELVMKSINVLDELQELVDSTEKKMSTLADCIQKQLFHFLGIEVCEAAMIEETISPEQFYSEVKQKNIALEETVRQQIKILFDVRISFPCISQGIIIFEESMEKSLNLLQKTKERMVSNDKTFSIFADDIKKQLYQLVDSYEAAAEGTTNALQSNSEIFLKNFLTKEQVKLLNKMLVYYDNRFITFRKGTTKSLEAMGKLIGVIKKMKETIVSNENELSIFANDSQNSLAQLAGCEVSKAADEGQKIPEQFDFKIMQRNVLTKEAVQIKNDILFSVLTDFIRFKQKITLFEKILKDINDTLPILVKEIASDENELSIHVGEIQKQLDHLVEVEICEAMKATELSPGKVVARHSTDGSIFV